jgi:LysM domain
MSLPYTVKKGDTLSAIARQKGFKSWQEIYNHPENEAFRLKRPNPNLIFPGDILILPGLGPKPPQPPAPTPPTPPPQPELPTSTRFVIHRMASQTTFEGKEEELFFHFTDMSNGLLAIYWLQLAGRPMTTLTPPSVFKGTSASLTTKGPQRITELECLAVYASSQSAGGELTSLFVLNLSSGAVQCRMPHHLIGPGGLLSGGGPNSGGASTALSGTLRFVKRA